MFGIKNLLALVGLAVVAFVGAGYYLGWYKIGAQADSQGHKEIKIQVNASQVQEDLAKGKSKVIQILEKKDALATTQTNPQSSDGPVAPPPPPPAPPAPPLGPPPSLPQGYYPSAPSSPPRTQPVDSWPF